MFIENCSENVVSDLLKNTYVSTKLLFGKKCAKTGEEKNTHEQQSLADFGDTTSSSCGFLRLHFQNSFP